MRKEREDVFGGESAWDNADKTKIQCPKDGCDGDEAAFYQVQIRSADEPMTGFYKVSSGSALLAYRTMQRSWADHMAVYDLRQPVERELIWQMEWGKAAL